MTMIKQRLAGARRMRAAWWRGPACGILLAAVLCAGALAQEPDGEAPTETEVAQATASVLAGAQLSQLPLDDNLSTRFLNGYLNALDAAHLVFLQSDLDEFSWFRPDLAQMTAAEGDTWPAHMIYERFLRRLEREVNFQTNFLHTATFDFTGHDSWQLDRHDSSRPRDLEAAQALWQEQVRSDYLHEKLAGAPAAEILRKLTHRYERRLQIVNQLNFAEILEIYLDAFAQAFDPHSDYFGQEEAQEFTSDLNLSLAGIGGSLVAKDGSWVVGDLVPGGPAALSGSIHPGDRILAVAQEVGEPEDVTDMPAWHVVHLIRGPQGSTVRLTILPAGQPDAATRIVSVVRADIRLTEGYATASIVDLPLGQNGRCRMGIINLPLFYESSGTNGGGASADTARLIQRLEQEGVAGLILDLRRNPGGSLEEAIRLTGLFIPAGPVVQTRNATGKITVVESPAAAALYGGPLVVLTSRVSASSSEIVAGALQDYGRALLAGDSATFGKGTVQTLVPLRTLIRYPGFGAIKVTIAQCYRPSGASTQLKGVSPDIVLPSETDRPDIGEPRFQNALPWDTVPGAVYREQDLVRPVLAALRDKSNARVAAQPWFRLIHDKLTEAEIESGRTTSLNESAQRRQQAAADQFRVKLDKFHAADYSRAQRIWDVTLANGVDVAKAPENGPTDDMVLCETENILADYIQLLGAEATKPPGQPAIRFSQARPPDALSVP
jgi:carboxyl-terminal processing protease